MTPGYINRCMIFRSWKVTSFHIGPHPEHWVSFLGATHLAFKITDFFSMYESKTWDFFSMYESKTKKFLFCFVLFDTVSFFLISFIHMCIQ
jgi:hypothetical protein